MFQVGGDEDDARLRVQVNLDALHERHHQPAMLQVNEGASGQLIEPGELLRRLGPKLLLRHGRLDGHVRRFQAGLNCILRGLRLGQRLAEFVQAGEGRVRQHGHQGLDFAIDRFQFPLGIAARLWPSPEGLHRLDEPLDRLLGRLVLGQEQPLEGGQYEGVPAPGAGARDGVIDVPPQHVVAVLLGAMLDERLVVRDGTLLNVPGTADIAHGENRVLGRHACVVMGKHRTPPDACGLAGRVATVAGYESLPSRKATT